MDAETPFRIALVMMTVANIAVRRHYHRMAGTTRASLGSGREGKVFFRRVLLLLPWMVAPMVYMLHPGWMAWSAVSLADAWRWLGMVCGAISFFGLWWVHATLGANFSPALRVRQDHALITSGPYRWVRHPMYTFGLLGWASAGLMTANWFIGLGAIALWVFVLRRLPDEEAMMREAFGEEYRAYEERTGRLLPGRGRA